MIDYVSFCTISKVIDGKTDFQTAIPNGKYQGDVWFITDEQNMPICQFVWDGSKWINSK